MTKISIPSARTLLGQTREENQRLREELAKVREINAEQVRQMRVIREETEWYREQLRKAQQRLSAQLPQVARSE
jgi:hypothetical protein